MDTFSELEDFGKAQRRRISPTIVAIDSQRTRSALLRSQKGIDGNKNVKGLKRNIIIDKNGDILGASTTPAKKICIVERALNQEIMSKLSGNNQICQ